MSFRPYDVVRRARIATVFVCGVLVFLASAFFRAQVVENQGYRAQSEQNRLREVPTPAPRGRILDRKNQPIAENVVGYSVALLTQREDTLRATLARLRATISLTDKQFEDAIKRYRRDPTRPTVIVPDASFDVVSELEEHHSDFPSLIIQSAPKRIYPDGEAVGAISGYIGEINDRELSALTSQGYKPGQQIGKSGLEKQYEAVLRGREGMQYVEVDARNRIVQSGALRQGVTPQEGPPLYTNIDLDLQEFIHTLFGDSISGAAIAIVPQTGEVRALYSSPAIDPNRWIGGVPSSYYDSLRADPRKPLLNWAVQTAQPPGSTFKLATSVMGLADGLVNFDSHMPQSCNGYYYYGNRAWRCWKKEGHGSLNLTNAIAQSCDVFFYQLGLRIALNRYIAGGVALGFNKKTGIDLPEESKPSFPPADYSAYFNQKYGKDWSGGAINLNLAIGQGENAQTVVSMARFYSALATDGTLPVPMIKRGTPQHSTRIPLTQDQLSQLRKAMMGVVSEGGTAARAAIKGVNIAGKTGTAQTMRYDANGKPLYYAWFAGMAPAENPQIVVVVMVPNVTFEGATSAGFATQIIAHYLHVQIMNTIENTG